MQMAWNLYSRLLGACIDCCNFLRIYYALKVYVLYFTLLSKEINTCMQINKLGLTMIFSMVFVMHRICWYYWLCPELIGCMQLVNYCSIIQLDRCMRSFYCHDVFIRKMEFAVNLDNNKVLNNLLICLVLKLHGYRPNGLRVIAVWICCQIFLSSG
jgi:hypothetical protein